MVKKNVTYESPDLEVTRIELESPVCSGSVDITAQAPTGQGISITAQDVNTDFNSNNDFSSGTAWDTNTNN